MPLPKSAAAGRNWDPDVTKVRNAASPHGWRWLGVESRCVVPFTSFAEMSCNRTARDRRLVRPRSEPALAFLASIWSRWTSIRTVKEGKTTNSLPPDRRTRSSPRLTGNDDRDPNDVPSRSTAE